MITSVLAASNHLRNTPKLKIRNRSLGSRSRRYRTSYDVRRVGRLTPWHGNDRMFQLAWNLWSDRPYSYFERIRLGYFRFHIRCRLPCNIGYDSCGIQSGTKRVPRLRGYRMSEGKKRVSWCCLVCRSCEVYADSPPSAKTRLRRRRCRPSVSCGRGPIRKPRSTGGSLPRPLSSSKNSER